MVTNITQNSYNDIYLTLFQNNRVESSDFQDLFQDGEDSNKTNGIDETLKNQANKLIDELNTLLDDAVKRVDNYSDFQEENKYKDRFQNIIDGIMLKLSQKIEENNNFENLKELEAENQTQNSNNINTENLNNDESLNEGLDLIEVKSIIKTSLMITSNGNTGNSAIQSVQNTVNQISEAIANGDTKALTSIIEKSGDIVKEAKEFLKSENLFKNEKDVSFSKDMKNAFDVVCENKIKSELNID